jgi:hypothetical protein
MVYDTAKLLAGELKNSVEYREFTVAKARAMENNTTRALIDEYNKLQIRSQGGDDRREREKRFAQAPAEDRRTAAVRFGRLGLSDGGFRLKRMLGDVYKIPRGGGGRRPWPLDA